MLNASSLDSSAAAVSSAKSLVVINGDDSDGEFWSEIPSMPNAYSITVGSAISFRYNNGHNVWLMPTEAAYDACDFNAATELANSGIGGGQRYPIPPERFGWPNQFSAVATEVGTLLFACDAVFRSHCGRGQKIRVTVSAASTSSGDEDEGIPTIVLVVISACALALMLGAAWWLRRARSGERRRKLQTPVHTGESL